jgi:hypothetical protein
LLAGTCRLTNGALVILLHGYGGNRTAMLWHAEQLTRAGYGVLMYDERASGESEGTYRSYGWEDPRDVGGALAFLKEKMSRSGKNRHCRLFHRRADRFAGRGLLPADRSRLGGRRVHSARAGYSQPTNPIYALAGGSNYMLDWMFEVRLGIDAPAPMIEIIDDIAPRPVMLVGSGIPFPFVGSEGDHLKYYAQYAGENAEPVGAPGCRSLWRSGASGRKNIRHGW